MEGGRTLYLDPFSGIAGDMFLGLLMDLGVDENRLVEEFERLGVRFDLAVSRVNKNGISAVSTKVTPAADGEGDEEHGHDHDNQQAHDHEHKHDHGDTSESDEAQPHGRGLQLSKILDILERLSEPTRSKTKEMFTALVEAEAQVHGTTVDSVHLHEAGAVDAIVEIVGAVKGLELLGVDHVCCGLVNTGTGFARMAHGKYPVPVPATAELLKGIPVRMDSVGGVPAELVTPTGALILSQLVDEYGPVSMTVERIGYGAGQRDLEIPNVVRGYLGHSASGDAARRLALLESNIDDMNPELYGHLMDLLYQGGALDVFFTPVQMKKNRPGVRISVLSEVYRKDGLIDTLMKESSTLGVRVSYPERFEAERETLDVETELGTARVKVAHYHGQTVTVSPEYESCRLLSRQSDVPLKEVYNIVLQAARAQLGQREARN